MDDQLGEATIVYEGPDGTVEQTVANEHVAYFQDHWILRTETTDEGDVVKRIPKERVYHVERTVDEFREEVNTLTNQVESFAEELRDRFLGTSDNDPDEPERIDVGSGRDDPADERR
ncbi:hypothetical protein [Halosegnis sp.]|uniref:hypothetical protein n=1 Tax=Halosegnis sp. TaxID=2864959 RepID=UPI0035D4940C